MITVQIRITRKIANEIDRFVLEGLYPSRSEFIRTAARRHIEQNFM
jgi:Arc/MetJ-type ribon-helix-helix transcriptional regulator